MRGRAAISRVTACTAWAVALVTTIAAAQTPPQRVEDTYAEHTRAVEAARAGRHDEGLAILRGLLRYFPNDYPLNRDFIVIAAWKSDCTTALERYDHLRSRPAPEPYFAISVSDCLLDNERPKEAAALLQEALVAAPNNEDLTHALEKARLARPFAERDHRYREAIFDLHSDESDQGLREWRAQLEGSAPVAAGTRVYGRYLVTRASDEALRSGDLHRGAVGLRQRIGERWRTELEASTDTRMSGKSGAATRVTYEPRDTLQLEAAYTTYADDIPLRARAADIDAKRWDAGAAYRSIDYLWDGRVTVSGYDFSDSNRRRSVYATTGYAWEMLPYREQRLYVELYQGNNTLDNVVYFNPTRDRSIGLLHRTDFVYESRYKRHVDSLFLSVSSYEQENFGTHGRWSISFEQDYDFDEFNGLTWSAGYSRNVYDGGVENEARYELRYVRRF